MPYSLWPCFVAATASLVAIAAVVGAPQPSPNHRAEWIQEPAPNVGAQNARVAKPRLSKSEAGEPPIVGEEGSAEAADELAEASSSQGARSAGYDFYRDAEGNSQLESGEFGSERCEIGLDDVPDPPRYEDFPADASVERPARLRLDSSLAREFRSVLRDAAVHGADLGGRYVVAKWGCGSPCYRWAVIDLLTGRAHFPPDQIFMMFGPSHVRAHWLTYRNDSRLLVFAGMSHTFGDAERRTDVWYETITYLEMAPSGLRVIRVVPVADLCPAGSLEDLPLVRSPYSR